MKNFLNTLIIFFRPPIFEGDEEKTRSAKLLYQIITIIWGLPVLLISIMLLNKNGRGEVIPPAIVISLILLALMIFTCIGWVRLASTIITAMIVLVFGYADFQNAGNIQPSTLIIAIAIIMSGLLLGRRAPIVVAILIVISHGTIVALQMRGDIKVVSSPALGIENIVITGIMILMIASLLQFVISRLQYALNQARTDEAELQSRNRELEQLSRSLEQRVADRTKALATVSDISTAASTILETERLLNQVVNLSKDRFELYHSHIYLLDETGRNLVLAAGAGDPGRKMVSQGHSIPLNHEQSLVARAARERKGVTVNDVTQAPDFLANPLLPNTRSELAVPMIAGETVIGVFDVQSDEVGRFADADINVQTTLASQIANAVQNARLYTQAETSRQEAQSLVENAAEAIAVLDLETGHFAELNENASKLFGLSRQELLNVGPAQMSPSRQPDGRDSTEKAMALINEAMQKGANSFEWLHSNAQGDEIPCEIRLVRLPGEHPRLRVSILDITDRKRYEDFLARRTAELEAVASITEKIQSTTTIEAALQIAARELGHVFGRKPAVVTLDPAALAGEIKRS